MKRVEIDMDALEEMVTSQLLEVIKEVTLPAETEPPLPPPQGPITIHTGTPTVPHKVFVNGQEMVPAWRLVEMEELLLRLGYVRGLSGSGGSKREVTFIMDHLDCDQLCKKLTELRTNANARG